MLPSVWVPSIEVRELRALVAHHDRLVKQRTQIRNRWMASAAIAFLLAVAVVFWRLARWRQAGSLLPARVLREETGAEIFSPEREPVPGAEKIEEGKHFQLGKIDIEARLTWGHSPGGTTFVVNGLARPVAIVGDSLFAGSMGGGSVSYKDAVQNNLEKILTLSDETIICPGHGPMTTVGEEKKHNPFFAHKV